MTLHDIHILTEGVMDWAHFKDAVLLLGCGYVANQMRAIAHSVVDLNIKIAQILERVEGHEKRITRIEDGPMGRKGK